MAASIYATPPPDLSSEDTALSDVSNTSSTNNNVTVASAVTVSSAVSSTSATASSLSSSSSLNQNTTSYNPTHHQYQQSTKVINNNNIMTNTTCETKSSASPKLSTSKTKRTIADVFKDKTMTMMTAPNQSQHHNSASSFAPEESPTNETDESGGNAAMAAVAVAANAAMQMQLLEALNDAAKKRRKQHNPTRMDDENKRGGVVGSSGGGSNSYDDAVDDQQQQQHLQVVHAIKREQVSPDRTCGSQTPAVDYEDKLSKMFLPKSMEHLKETFELLQQQQQKQLENISKSHKATDEEKPQEPKGALLDDMAGEGDANEYQHQTMPVQEDDEARNYNNNPYQTFCKECGENFENEFKLGLHMLQEHNEGPSGADAASDQLTSMSLLASVKVKMERKLTESPLSGHNSSQGHLGEHQNAHGSTIGKEQHQQHQAWMRQPQMTPMGFPFPPEAAAAAALQAGGYLPLLAVPGFGAVDGLNRPPLRIFNPEAFCELCNKEFCNKYFLKTHKANKHGIYDPVPEVAAGSSAQQNNTMNAMSQMFQLQMQQQQQQHFQQQHQMQMDMNAQQQPQHQQQQPPQHHSQTPSSHPKLQNDNIRKDRDEKSTVNTGNPQSSPVYCDICSKRFTNIFAMRRHRIKVHEQNANTNVAQRNSPNSSQPSGVVDSQPDGQASKQFQMPEGFRQDFALEQEEVSFTPQPRKLSPHLQQLARDANFAHDKLKRLGVINPEAFCELCCKEYCNKYFLRTHKWKRHGIFMPPEESDAVPKMSSWPFVNMASAGLPVNLMMAQRLMASVDPNNGEMDQQSQSQRHLQQPPSKRIKLETTDPDEELMPNKEPPNDENQENRSENNQRSSVPSTPDPHKAQNESQAASPASEAAVGLQNLQKLQSMIQQLSDLNGKRPIPCHLCGREMENQYALQAHLMTEHSGGAEGIDTPLTPLNFPPSLMLQQQHQQQTLLKHSPNSSPIGALMPPLMGGLPGITGELRCTPCDREFSNLPEFQKHITEVHLLANIKGGSPLREGFVTPDRPVNSSSLGASQATRNPFSMTPTSSYCEICNKELCNKYFMKTHMQRMHGIEIENGAQIGGVVCNICNKELCSKYFLRVHKHNTHGIIEEGSPLPQPRQNGVSAETSQPQPPGQLPTGAPEADNFNISPFGGGGPDAKCENSNPNEFCPLCQRRFRSPKWLRSHLLNDHGASGMEKLRELEQQFGSFSKPSSPTLKIPNGSSSTGSTSNAATPTPHQNIPSPAQLAQALQNLNAQQLLQNLPKNQMPMAHLKLEQNDASPSRLKEYQCSLCSFSTPYYAFLFIHERTHSIMNSGQEQQEEEDDEHKTQDMEPESREPASKNVRANVDGDGDDNQTTEEHHMADDTQPTNLSLRTPSPRRNSVTIKEELIKDNSNSPPPTARSPQENAMKPSENHKENPINLVKSAACSPIFGMPNQQQLLQEMAEQFGKTASYAVPREMTSANASGADPPPHMQAFVLEEQLADNECNRFVPAIIYLPVRERLTGPMTLSFNLTPV
uniref:C2H2-type domain-containing protein n=1 Tax=Stomoxys calcitrans TaxID=35570 RepID=A0A1I8PBJ0_STOCA